MKYKIEIQAAEGGQDSALFVKDLSQAYIKLSQRLGWTAQVVSSKQGGTSILFEGEDLTQLLNEPGGHRIQRVPPTERKGRVHTSTLTVAVLDETHDSVVPEFDESEFRLEWYSGTGAGGQHRNKHQNSARITHLPSGTTETAQCRSRENSYNEAMTRLKQRLTSNIQGKLCKQRTDTKKTQVGTGSRGSYIRSYCLQHGIVKDVRSGKQISVKQFNQGMLDLLW